MRILLICGLVAFAVGCKKEPTASTDETTLGLRALSELATVLPLFSTPPTKVADLTPYRESAPLAHDAVKSGAIVVVWGVSMPGEGDAGKGTTDIVAYEKEAPTAGGLVLLHNGTVKKMTAAEFQAAPKAR